VKRSAPGTTSGAWAGPLLIALAGLAMAAWTWGTWPDPLVDFGRELYVPWRLCEGQVLFRDIAWFNGPLSPYFNALLFGVFGVGLSTLVWANLFLLAVGVALLWRLCRRMADALAATIACLLFVLVFAFGQLVGIANYNWVCPYSHEATHGVLLGLAALACLDRWHGGASEDEPSGGGLLWVAGAGLLCGLAFLTKAETFLAALAGSLAALAAGHWSSSPANGRRASLARVAAVAAAFGGALLVPIAAAFGLLSAAMPGDLALRGVLGSWPSVLAGEVSELAFYRAGMGLDDPGQRLGELGLWAVGWTVLLGTAAALGGRLRGSGLAWAMALVVAATLWFLRESIPWNDALRPLPLFVLIGGLLAFVRVVRERRSATELAFAVFSLTLLGKLILHARALNYGFTLALPATALVAIWIVGRLPAWLDQRGANGGLLRGAACAMLLFGAAEYVRTTAAFLSHKTHVVGTGADAFRADLRGSFVNETLSVLESSGASSLLVVPEGVMLNYLARIPNPTPFVNFMPPEEILFGEQAWIAALEQAPPQVVCVVHKDTSEYGFPRFGEHYAADLGTWIEERYRQVTQLGQPPLKPGTVFGIRILALGKER